MTLYFIPPSAPFLPSLAQGLQQRYAASKTRPLILLPTKESCDRFKTHEPFPCQVVALGDLSYFFSHYGQGLPSPIPALQRQIFIQQWLMQKADFPNPSLAMVHSLLDLLDEFYVNEQPLERLLQLKIGEWADYWRLSLGRLQQLVRDWPRLLAARNYAEAALIHRLICDRVCQAWQKQPPNFPIIIAGTRGSRPATRRLIEAVLQLSEGAVILPSYDPAMLDEALPMTHPVGAIQNLIQSLDISAIKPWCSDGNKKVSTVPIVRQIMRPANTTHEWHQAQTPDQRPPWQIMAFPNRQQEALHIIQLIQTFQNKERVGIICADPYLRDAIRVLADLHDLPFSLTHPAHLGQSPVAELLQRFAYCWDQDFTPSSFLNLLQHPLVMIRDNQDQWQNWLYHINKHVLRGPKPASGWQGLRQLLWSYEDDFNGLVLDQLDEIWHHKKITTGEQWFDCLDQTLRALCPTWVEAGGDKIIDMMAQLRPVIGGYDKDRAQQLLQEALRHIKWPETQIDHQGTIDLLTPTQARLLDYDVWILAGCQEGSWPAKNTESYWLNQAMRRFCGLPNNEWTLGHAAHDFCCPLWQGQKLFITFHHQEENNHVQPSRWVQRLEFVLQHFGWLAAMKQDFSQVPVEQPSHQVLPPAPTLPLEARPTTFSISDISCWRRNPYHFYAEKILKLKPLEVLEANPDRADYGRRLHQVLEEFVRTYPNQLPDEAENILLDLGQRLLQDFADKPSLWQLWWPRFCQIARWFVQHETVHRQSTQRLGVEMAARITIDIDQTKYILKGVIDRLDQGLDGSIHVIDYKTGGVPTKRDVVLGMAPQLPLETCLILDDMAPNQPIYLDYWQLQGAYEGGQVRQISDDGQVLAQQALDGLKTLITVFSQADTPYLAQPFSDWPPFASPYDHLARVDAWRWSIQDGDDR